MKVFTRNAGYFLKETKTIIKTNLLSNIFSILSTGLIFFILSMILTGWWMSNRVIEAIQGEAEISIYYQDAMEEAEVAALLAAVKEIPGVAEVRLVEEAEAYDRMEDILGKEASVLKYFDDNPFSPFIEAKIDLNKTASILDSAELMTGVEHIRDNREVLDRLQSLADMVKMLGLIISAAVAISTIVIISHIIRSGIYSNREQINTLRLLGAPESFIGFPFLLSGLFVTLSGGVIAVTLNYSLVKLLYGQLAGPLPFVPLPPQSDLITGMLLLMLCASLILGIVGSVFGLSSSNKS